MESLLYGSSAGGLQRPHVMISPPWTLGDVIRKLRQAKGWTQEELATRAEINEISVVRLERESERSERTTIERVARALDVSVADLYAFMEEITLLAELSAGERRHLGDYMRRLVEKRRAANRPQDVPQPADLPRTERESVEPIQKRRRR